MVEWTPEMKAMYEALRPEPEPEAHCYDCPQSENGNCAEYIACSSPGHPYDRGHCHWGYESIQKLATKEDETQ